MRLLLMKITEARKQRGIQDRQGKDPVQAVPVGEELRQLGIANQTTLSGAPVQGPLLNLPR